MVIANIIYDYNQAIVCHAPAFTASTLFFDNKLRALPALGPDLQTNITFSPNNSFKRVFKSRSGILMLPFAFQPENSCVVRTSTMIATFLSSSV